jgi:hypothetical protein
LGPAAPVVCVYNPLQLLLVFILIAGGGAPNLKASCWHTLQILTSLLKFYLKLDRTPINFYHEEKRAI